MRPGGEVDARADDHVGRQQEERDRDDPQHPALCSLVRPAAGQFGAQPAQYQGGGDKLDDRVEAEAGQGEGASDDARGYCHAGLDQHPRDRELLQPDGLPVTAGQWLSVRGAGGVHQFCRRLWSAAHRVRDRPGRETLTSPWIPSAAIYGASNQKLTATSFCARRSDSCPASREPVNRQITMMLARASIPLSRPKPSSAADPAITAAATPTPASRPS